MAGAGTKKLTPTKKGKARGAMASFMAEAERFEWRWHYSQTRPGHGYGIEPFALHVGDCSLYVSFVFNWPLHSHGIYLDDPLGFHYNGWGYTGTEITWLEAHGKRIANGAYLVGDIAIQGASKTATVHTIVCRKQGDKSTSIWSSFGRESGPNPVKVDYHPQPLLGVWRHPALL